MPATHCTASPCMEIPDQAISAITSAAASPAIGEAEQQIGHLFYQVAVVVAVLLFLISFWSC